MKILYVIIGIVLIGLIWFVAELLRFIDIFEDPHRYHFDEEEDKQDEEEVP